MNERIRKTGKNQHVRGLKFPTNIKKTILLWPQLNSGQRQWTAELVVVCSNPSEATF